jgi:hypothetical protein
VKFVGLLGEVFGVSVYLSLYLIRLSIPVTLPF